MDYGIPSNALHVFPSRIIGKHEWCMVIVPSSFTFRNDDRPFVMEYYWRRAERFGSIAYHWQASTEWPAYNHNDGSWGGMPRTLRTYWSEHREAIAHWVKHGRAPVSSAAPQLSLFAEA